MIENYLVAGIYVKTVVGSDTYVGYVISSVKELAPVKGVHWNDGNVKCYAGFPILYVTSDYTVTGVIVIYYI